MGHLRIRELPAEWVKINLGSNRKTLPGWINTDLSINAKKTDPELQGRIVARTPAGRWGESTDIVGTAIFLSSRASDFVTGTAIPVDGGYAVQG